MTGATADDDGGFYGYIPTTTDPGSALLVATIVLCVLMNAILPCLVAIGSHHDKKRGKRVEDDPWKVGNAAEGLVMQRGDEETSIRSVSTRALKLASSAARSQAIMRGAAPSVASFGQTSVASVGTMTPSVANQSVATGVYGKRSRTQKRFRRALEKRVMLNESGVKVASFFRFDRAPATVTATYHYPLDRQKVDIDDQSFLSKMDTDEVSVKSFTMDAEHEDFLPKQFVDEDKEIEITCSGADAWWKPNWVLSYFDRIIALSEWDFEMRKVVRLCLPFAIQAFFTGMLDVMTVAVIGNFLGTKEVSAYVVVGMFLSLTNEFVGGFWNAITTLCSQAVGANQNKLCGQYVQMAMLLYISFSIPCMFLWWTKIEDVVLWFGFDEETAEIGRDYARISIFSHLMMGVSETLHGLLDVIGLENYSTVMGVSEDVLDFVLVLQLAMFSSPQLYHIGMLHLGVGVLFLILNVSVIICKGWFKPYLPGLIGSFSLTNYKAVWLMCKTAFTLSVGFLLMDGEWELLTLLASFLGPAEVAAWGIIGSLWSAIEALTEAIGDAAEVRCAFLLGCGKPKHAQVSSYKSMLIALIVSFLVTSILFTMGEDIATWLTADPVLQKIIVDLLPLFGIGNITMTIGSMSWTLLGAQGRYQLATTVAFGGSWLLTIPLAAIASVLLNLNLQGQTAAVVLGYGGSGLVNSYFLFRSDWKKLSQTVMASHDVSKNDPTDNAAEDLSSSSSDSDSDSSSSSDSSNASSRSQSVPVKRINGVQQVLKTP